MFYDMGARKDKTSCQGIWTERTVQAGGVRAQKDFLLENTAAGSV